MALNSPVWQLCADVFEETNSKWELHFFGRRWVAVASILSDLFLQAGGIGCFSANNNGNRVANRVHRLIVFIHRSLKINLVLIFHIWSKQNVLCGLDTSTSLCYISLFSGCWNIDYLTRPKKSSWATNYAGRKWRQRKEMGGKFHPQGLKTLFLHEIR